MKRRQFIKASLGSGVAVSLLGSAAWLNVDAYPAPLTIEAALNQLDKLSNKTLKSLNQWDIHQVFTHCAQSVEFSMSGFPEHKPALFKSTVGAVALSVFAAKGRMTHGLNEVIPGAPALIANTDPSAAIQRLATAMRNFQDYQGTLEPHFAYGDLSKQEYEIAHAMHLYNHLEDISVS